jgi:comEA protein
VAATDASAPIQEDSMRRTKSVALLAVALWITGIVLHADQEPKENTAKVGAALVNLNTATQVQLETLPGIGAKTAVRIIEYRQKSGGFKKIEDLMNVRGVGEKSFLKLKPLITVTPLKPEQTADSRP